jgi:hypothetical protein
MWSIRPAFVLWKLLQVKNHIEHGFILNDVISIFCNAFQEFYKQ